MLTESFTVNPDRNMKHFCSQLRIFFRDAQHSELQMSQSHLFTKKKKLAKVRFSPHYCVRELPNFLSTNKCVVSISMSTDYIIV
jgi:hypothetical protein